MQDAMACLTVHKTSCPPVVSIFLFPVFLSIHRCPIPAQTSTLVVDITHSETQTLQHFHYLHNTVTMKYSAATIFAIMALAKVCITHEPFKMRLLT